MLMFLFALLFPVGSADEVQVFGPPNSKTILKIEFPESGKFRAFRCSRKHCEDCEQLGTRPVYTFHDIESVGKKVQQRAQNSRKNQAPLIGVGVVGGIALKGPKGWAALIGASLVWTLQEIGISRDILKLQNLSQIRDELKMLERSNLPMASNEQLDKDLEDALAVLDQEQIPPTSVPPQGVTEAVKVVKSGPSIETHTPVGAVYVDPARR